MSTDKRAADPKVGVEIANNQVGRDIIVYQYLGGTPRSGEGERVGQYSLPFGSEDASTALKQRERFSQEVVGESLVVFIHGGQKDARETWASLEGELANTFEDSFHASRFDDPGGFLSKRNIQGAVEELEGFLERLPQYDHYLFITHATGGVAFKKAFAKALEQALDAAPDDLEKRFSFAAKTRLILSIDIPNDGSFQEVEADFRSALDLSKKEGFNVPRLVELRQGNPAYGDPLKQPSVTVSTRSLNMRAERRMLSSTARQIAETLTFCKDKKAQIAFNTQVYASLLEDAYQPVREKNGKRIKTSSQVSAAMRILEVAGQTPSKVILLAGPGGVGKTTVVRRLCERQSIRYLNGDADSEPLVIVLPMRLIDVDKDKVEELSGEDGGQMLLDLVKARWVEWANDITETNAQTLQRTSEKTGKSWVDRAYLDKLLSQAKLIFVLDGADEFLARYQLRLKVLNQLATTIEHRYKQSLGLKFVISLRNTVPSFSTVAATLHNIVPIENPSPEEAERLCPGIGSLLAQIKEEKEVCNTLLTPLFLVNLRPWVNKLTPESLQEAVDRTFGLRAELLFRSLESLVESRIGILCLDKEGRPSDIISALSICAYAFYQRAYEQTAGAFLGDMSLSDLYDYGVKVEWRWKAQAKSTDNAPHSLQAGLKWVCDRDALSILVQNTVFVPTGVERVRFAHDLWHTVMVAYYMARCLNDGSLGEFNSIIFQPEMSYMAGHLCAGGKGLGIVDFDTSHALEGAMDVVIANRIVSSKDALFQANVIALILGNERGHVWRRVSSHLLRHIEDLSAIGAIVTVNALGHLPLYWRSDKKGLRQESAELIEFLTPHYQKVEKSTSLNPVVCELARYYLAVFEDDPEYRASRPGDAMVESTVASVLRYGDQRYTPFEWRTLQGAILTLVKLVFFRGVPESRVGATVYYYFLLAAILRSRQARLEENIEGELIDFTMPNGIFDKTVRAQPSFEKLKDVYAWNLEVVHGA